MSRSIRSLRVQWPALGKGCLSMRSVVLSILLLAAWMAAGALAEDAPTPGTPPDSPVTGDSPGAPSTVPDQGGGLSVAESRPTDKRPVSGGQPDPNAGNRGGIVIPDEVISLAPADSHATLTFMNREITRFRATVFGAPPAARVENAARRLQSQVNEGRLGPVEVLRINRAVLVSVAGLNIFAITELDLDVLANETLDSRASDALARLKTAMAEADEVLSPRLLLFRSIHALAATLIFLAWLWVLKKLRRLIERRFLRLTGKGLRGSLASSIATEREQRVRVVNMTRRIVSVLFTAAVLVSIYGWLTYVLRLFPYTRPWGEKLGGFLLNTAAWMGLGIVRAIPGLFIVLVILAVTRIAVRLVHLIFSAVEDERFEIPGIHPETAETTRRLVVVALWLLAVVVAYPYIPGSSSAAFKGLSVFMGVVLSLGSSGIVNQAMSGLMLIYSRAIRVGDFVQVGEVEGTVIELGVLSTKVRTVAGEEVTVPNAVVISRETTNFSRFAEEGVAVGTTVTIGYDTPWRQVHALLELAAERTPGLRKKPRPFVLQTGLADHYPEYRLMAVIDRPEKRNRVLSQLHAHIQDLFNEHGVQIMSPHYVADPPEPLVVPPDRWRPPPAGPDQGGAESVGEGADVDGADRSEADGADRSPEA